MASQRPGAPEIPDLAESVAIMWQRIGAQVDLNITDYEIIRNKFRARNAHSTVAITRTSATPTFRLFGAVFGSIEVMGSTLQAYQHPWLEDSWARFLGSTDIAKRRDLLRAVGQHMYDEYASLPLVFLFTQVAVDPAVIADYECNMLHWGMMRCLEFIQPVYR